MTTEEELKNEIENYDKSQVLDKVERRMKLIKQFLKEQEEK